MAEQAVNLVVDQAQHPQIVGTGAAPVVLIVGVSILFELPSHSHLNPFALRASGPTESGGTASGGNISKYGFGA